MMKKYIFRLSLALLFLNVEGSAQTQKANLLNIKTVNDLVSFFKYTPDRIPLVCGHRGGVYDGYPENAIATLEYTLTRTAAFFEVDPRLTKDSVIVVMHDETLDRTTTGKGKLSNYTWAEVKKLRLKDSNGKETPYRVHTLDEMIKWSKGKTILMLDKKDVPLERLLEVVTRNKAESHILISAYAPEEAKYYYEKNNKLMFEAFIKNKEQMKAFEDTGVPWTNMVAYLGQPKNRALYDSLHERGAMVMAYTAPVLEKNPDKVARIKSYQDLINNGIDILLADQVLEVSEAIKPLIPTKSSKWRFFTNNN